MHPKPLLDLCIDYLVNATACYQRVCNDYEAIWRDVGHVWADLWYLPPCVPARATQLLHMHLLHTHLLHDYHASDTYEMTCPFLTLLAVKARKITIVPVARHLPSLFSPAFFTVNGVFNKEFLLQELDLTGIDLIQDMSVLVALLPMCPELTILKLGGNTTPEVLCAAKACPLTVLHISERLVWEPRVTENYLIEFVIGSTNHSLEELMEHVLRGRTLHVTPTWPQLSDFSTGTCFVQEKFLLLILIVFKKLHCLASSVVDVHNVVQTFYELQKELPDMHTLSLKTNTDYCHQNMMAVFSCIASELEHLKVSISSSDILQVPYIFPSLKVLHINISCVLSALSLASVGMQLTVLGLHYIDSYEVRQRDIVSLLQGCPLLQDLTLSFVSGIKCDHLGIRDMPCFENITSLTCKSPRFRQEPLKCLLKMFPKLQTLSIEGRVKNFEFLLQQLTQYHELRILKLARLEKLPVAIVCELPRLTSDRRSWELYVSPHLISSSDIKKLQNCGWTCIPISEYGFH